MDRKLWWRESTRWSSEENDLVPFLCVFMAVKEAENALVLPEFVAVCEIYNIPFRWNEEDAAVVDLHPHLRVFLPDEDACKKIADRALSIRVFLQPLGVGKCDESLRNHIQSDNMQRKVDAFRDSSFRLVVHGYKIKYSMEAQRNRMNDCLAALNLNGPVNVKYAQCIFWLFEDHEYCDKSTHSKDRCVSDVCLRLVGREIVMGAGRSRMDLLAPRKRAFLGTTSMSSLWSILMSNLARVRAGMFVMDPFVGTGSLLLASALFGAYVYGSDIDGRVIRGKTGFRAKYTSVKDTNMSMDNSIDEISADPGMSVRANFVHYGIEHRLVDLSIVDQAHSPYRFPVNGWVDAIVTDPPYGVRAGARRVGVENKSGELPVIISRLTRVPPSIAYEVEDVCRDLLNFAAKTLRVNGHLVFWYPTPDFCERSKFPFHPSMILVDCGEQRVSMKVFRYLLSYRKIREVLPEDQASVFSFSFSVRELALGYGTTKSVATNVTVSREEIESEQMSRWNYDDTNESIRRQKKHVRKLESLQRKIERRKAAEEAIQQSKHRNED